MSLKFSLRSVIVVRPSPFNNFVQTSSTLKPLSQSKPNFMWRLFDRGTKSYINDLGHMTKMAATPIYEKNPLEIFFSGTDWPILLNLGM